MAKYLWILIVLLLSGCGGPGDLDSYQGTWYSGLDDRDEYGGTVSMAYRLEIDSDHKFTLEYRFNDDDEWRHDSSGTIRPTTVRLDGVLEKPGIDVGTAYGTLSAGGLALQIGGELRSFERRGGFSMPCWMWLAIGVSGGYAIREWLRENGWSR